MKRTAARIPGQREAVLAAIRTDRQPPSGASREQVRRWACERIDHGWTEGEAAVAAGLTVDEVRRAVAERARR